MALRETIVRIRDAMRTGQFVNEAAISNGVVLPILHELGWPVFDPVVVAPEYTVENRRVDFALCHPRNRPAVFVEVKQPGRSDGGDRQLFEYAFHLGVPFAVLTDGNEWHFYLPAGQGLYQERRVYKLDLVERDLDEAEERLKRYLAYESVVAGNAFKSASDDYASLRKNREIEETLPQAWKKLLESQDELLVDLLGEQVESLCGYRPDPDMVSYFLTSLTRTIVRGPDRSPIPQQQMLQAETTVRHTPNDLPASGVSKTEKIGFRIQGAYIQTRTARETLIRFFEEMGRRDSRFFQRFAALPRHGRSRRFLAEDRLLLYPDRPDLADEFSYQIASGWWVGTNYGGMQIRRIIEMACDVAGLQVGRDVQIDL